MTAASTPDTPIPPRGRLVLALWVAGMVGVVAIVAGSVPNLPELPPDVPLSVVVAGAIVQSGVLLALAGWVGAILAPRVGLAAPAFEALARRTSVASALAPQCRPGVLSGIVGGIALTAVTALAPSALAESGAPPLPLAARVLYGGITEEILLRWGFMTLVAWVLWRSLQRGRGLPTTALIWAAIVISALAFGAGHLPAVARITTLSTPIVGYIVLANAVLGVLFGYLFWTRGLEAAMLAHGLSHVVAQLVAAALSSPGTLS